MVKAKKGNLIILGLSDENVKRLQNDEPIKFNLKELGLDDIDVMIFHGKDEQTMYQMMKDSIHPYKTVIKNSRANEN